MLSSGNWLGDRISYAKNMQTKHGQSRTLNAMRFLEKYIEIKIA